MKHQFRVITAICMTVVLAAGAAACGKASQIAEAAGQLSSVAEQAVSEASSAVNERMSEASSAISEKMSEAAVTANEKASEASAAVSEKMSEASSVINEKMSEAAETAEEITAGASKTAEEKTAEAAGNTETAGAKAADETVTAENKTEDAKTEAVPTEDAGAEAAAGDGATAGDGAAAETESEAASGAAAETEAGASTEAEASSESATEAKPSVLDNLPEVGDEIHGFKITEITDFRQKNAKIVSMEHEKSGAELIYIACDDTDKAFTAFYRTVADNDKGIPHIFEHITLSGSGKYPDASLFDQLATGTYNTNMNAFTQPQHTGYILSSLSDDQLISLADVYMDGLTDPMALRDEHPLQREAYRFSLESPEAEITVTGAVFNEMEALNSGISAHALYNSLRLLYPYSIMSYECGGIRDDIITTTLEELKEFYAKYYHPSNMLIALYGDLEYKRYLEMFDRDYLSKYDRREIEITDDKYLPWKGEKSAVMSYPVAEDASAEGGSMITYAISLGQLPVHDRVLMSVVTALLTQENSPIRQAVEKAFPDSSFEAEIYDNISEPVLFFFLVDASAGDGEEFKETVDAAVEEIYENGLNKDIVEGIVNNQEMSMLLSAEEPGGLGVCQNFAKYWALTGDKLAYMECFRAIDGLEKEAEAGTLDKMIETYLLNPERSALLEMNPEPGLKEKQDEAFAKKLADKKAAMSRNEIVELVGETVEFNTWSALSVDSTLLEKLRCVTIQELPEDVTAAEITDTAEDAEIGGIRSISSVIGNAAYLNTDIYLDAQTVVFEDIHDFVFLGELLGSMATENHTADSLDTALKTNLYNYSFAPTVIYDDATGDPHPYLCVSFMELEDRVGDAWSLAEEILTSTDFTDTARIKLLASKAVTGMKMNMNMNPLSAALDIGLAAADPDRLYWQHAAGLDYLRYLETISGMTDRQAEALSERLHGMLSSLLNKNGMIYTAVGSEKTLTEGKKHVRAFVRRLDDTEREAADYSAGLEKLKLPKSIAVTVNDSVNYNGIVCSSDESGLDDSGSTKAILNVINNSLLYPTFRFDFGAYGFKCDMGADDGYLLSFRDPDIAPSFAFYDSLPGRIAELELTQDDVDDAVISVYSRLAYPQSPLSRAKTEISYALRGKKKSYAEDTLEKMKDAKTVTPQDVTAAAREYQKFIDAGARVTAGSAASINNNKELFELVITDLTK